LNNARDYAAAAAAFLRIFLVVEFFYVAGKSFSVHRALLLLFGMEIYVQL